MPARTLSLERGWIVRSHIDWEGELSILYKGVKPLLSRCVLKTLREIPKGKATRLFFVDFVCAKQF